VQYRLFRVESAEQSKESTYTVETKLMTSTNSMFAFSGKKATFPSIAGPTLSNVGSIDSKLSTKMTLCICNRNGKFGEEQGKNKVMVGL
jgi:hypothetical protein